MPLVVRLRSVLAGLGMLVPRQARTLARLGEGVRRITRWVPLVVLALLVPKDVLVCSIATPWRVNSFVKFPITALIMCS